MLALAGCGGSKRPPTSVRRDASSGLPPALSTSPAKPAAPRVPPPLAHLQRVLSRTIARAGGDTGALVYDLGARTSLFALRPGVGRPPASVEKFYTTAAVLSKLGPNARLHTIVFGAGHLGRGGVWHGDLYLKGGGDPSFGDGEFNRVWEHGYGPTAAQLAGQLRARGIRRVTGRLIGDASLFDRRPGGLSTAFAPDLPDFGGELSALTYDHGGTSGSLSPGAFAARQVARTLRSQHVKVKAAPDTGLTPKHARKLASVSSPPMSVLLSLMDVPSDDLFAEMLTKQLGVRFGRGGSIASGAQVISSVVDAYGIHPTILDGSGLSRSDRSSPAQVVAFLKAIWHTPIGRDLTASLPVVGVNGTVQTIAAGTPAQGHCFAKTGTLNGVSNLAGYCASQRHRSLAFALFLDGPNNWKALQWLGRMVEAIASY